MFDPRLCECKNNFKIETEGHFLPTWLLLRKEKKKKVKDSQYCDYGKETAQLNILMAATRDVSPTYTDSNWDDLRCQSISPRRCQAASCH